MIKCNQQNDTTQEIKSKIKTNEPKDIMQFNQKIRQKLQGKIKINEPQYEKLIKKSTKKLNAKLTDNE